ncbi:MAG: DMT family transporter [Fusobacterium sp. JB019]|nr:DMT family transporter [Fusobacterium sp. JB019]
MKTKKIAGNIAGFTTVFFWGITYISTKVLLEVFNPVEILFTRFLMGLIFLVLLYPKPLKIKDKKQEIYFALAGITGVTLFYLLENIALTYTMASNVGVISALAPFFTGIIGYIFMKNKEKLTKNFFIGFVLALIGVGLISFNGATTFKVNPVGDLLAVSSVIIWGIYGNLTRKLGSYGYNTIQVTRRTFIYGIIFMLPALKFFDFNVQISDLLQYKYLFNMVFLGLGASAICFVTWNYTVKVLGAVKASLFIYLIPIITVITSFIFLNERLTWMSFFGIIFAILGLMISNKKEKL